MSKLIDLVGLSRFLAKCKELFLSKDSIPDLDTIRSGAAAGATAVQPTDIVNMVESTTIRSIWVGTQAQYDAIVTKDINTEYNIVEEV